MCCACDACDALSSNVSRAQSALWCRSLFEAGQRRRVQLHVASRLRLSHSFFHATLSLVSLSVSLVSLVSPFRSPRGGRAAPARCARGRGPGRWGLGGALELAVDVDATLFSHTHSIQPAQRMCPKYSLSTVNRRPRPNPGPSRLPRAAGSRPLPGAPANLIAAGRASTLSHILSKSPCCTPYSLRGPTPVGNAPCVRAVGRAMAGVANS